MPSKTALQIINTEYANKRAAMRESERRGDADDAQYFAGWCDALAFAIVEMESERGSA